MHSTPSRKHTLLLLVGLSASVASMSAPAARADDSHRSAGNTTPAPTETGAAMKRELAAMMKHLSVMLEKMSEATDAGQATAADMAGMSRMMKEMSGLMQSMNGSPEKAAASGNREEMCGCGEKMPDGLAKMKASTPASDPSSNHPPATPSKESAPGGDEHAGHH
jgi:hypothetical protein